MKNIETILKELGIELTDEQKEKLKKEHNENYKTINEYEKQAEKIETLEKSVKDTEETLKTTQEKLKEFDTWYRYDDLLNEFKFIVIKRGEDDIAKEIDNSEVVKNHLNAFTFVDSEESYLDISSTKIREYIKENDIAKIKELTFDFVVEILVEKGLVHYEK